MSAWDPINFHCDYCGAEPGERCFTLATYDVYGATGESKPVQPHVSRIEKGNAVWLREHPRGSVPVSEEGKE